MKGSVDQQRLAKGLSIAIKAVSSRTTMPILANFLIEATNDQVLRIAATNLEIGINVWVGAKIEEAGAITVPAKLLSEFVSSLPQEKVGFDLDEKTLTFKLKCSGHKANMKGLDATDYPIIGGDDAARTTIALPPADFSEALGQVTFAASDDENRPTLTGVEVVISPEQIGLTTTDGYRLSRRVLSAQSPVDGETALIVPHKALEEISRIAKDASIESLVDVSVKESQIAFGVTGRGDSTGNGFDRAELVCPLIDGRFPQWRSTVPQSCNTTMVVDTAALLKSVKVAMLFARENNGSIRMSTTESGTIVLSVASDTGDNTSEIDAEIDGDEIVIALNGKYLIDVLTQISHPKVVIETVAGNRPAMLYSQGLSKDEGMFLIMPMNTQRQ